MSSRKTVVIRDFDCPPYELILRAWTKGLYWTVDVGLVATRPWCGIDSQVEFI